MLNVCFCGWTMSRLVWCLQSSKPSQCKRWHSFATNSPEHVLQSFWCPTGRVISVVGLQPNRFWDFLVFAFYVLMFEVCFNSFNSLHVYHGSCCGCVIILLLVLLLMILFCCCFIVVVVVDVLVCSCCYCSYCYCCCSGYCSCCCFCCCCYCFYILICCCCCFWWRCCCSCYCSCCCSYCCSCCRYCCYILVILLLLLLLFFLVILLVVDLFFVFCCCYCGCCCWIWSWGCKCVPHRSDPPDDDDDEDMVKKQSGETGILKKVKTCLHWVASTNFDITCCCEIPIVKICLGQTCLQEVKGTMMKMGSSMLQRLWLLMLF